MENGIEIEMMNVDLKLFRNIRRMATARRMPCQALEYKVLSVSLISIESSEIISSSISEGMELFTSSIFSYKASATLTAFAPDCFLIEM